MEKNTLILLFCLAVLLLFGQPFVSSITGFQVKQCSDTDGGRVYDVRGSVYGICKDCKTPVVGSNSDHCVDANKLREFYCVDETGWIREVVDCPNGCKDGACIKEEVVEEVEISPFCDDTDGKDYYVKGTLSTNYPQWQPTVIDKCATLVSEGDYRHTTSCEDDNCYNIEYYCEGTKPLRSIFKCPAGCDNGACIKETKCVDSDGGKNLYEVGRAESSGKGYEDSCSFLTNPKGILKEAVCKNDIATQIDIICPSEIPYCNRAVCSTVPPHCTDTDGGNYPYVKGTIAEPRTEDGPKHTDYCENLQTKEPWEGCSGTLCGVREYYCTDPYVTTTFQDIQCKEGCKDGACLSTPTPEENCTDSDGGKDYYTKGTVIDNTRGFTRTYVDKCGVVVDGIDMPNRLIEHYCEGVVGWQHMEYDCPNGCKDGACIKFTPSTTNCTDTDGGIDYYTKGTACEASKCITDYCQDKTYLMEIDCGTKGGIVDSSHPGLGGSRYKCPAGCQTGVCLRLATEDCTTTPFQDADRDGCHAGTDSDCGGIEGVDDPSITCFNNKDDDCDGMIDKKDDDLSCNLDCGDGICGWYEKLKSSKYYCPSDCEELPFPGYIIKNLDPYFCEDSLNPDWKWDIQEMTTPGPEIGVYNYFRKTSAADNPPSTGQCYYLPWQYGSICLEKLNVPPTNYLTTTIEYDQHPDLDESNYPGITTANTAVEISAPLDTAFELNNGKKTSTIWITAVSDGFEIFYKDINANPQIQHLAHMNDEYTPGYFNYGTNNRKIKFDYDQGGSLLNVFIDGYNENLVISFGVSSNIITSLGSIRGKAEPAELAWVSSVPATTTLLGLADEDHRMRYGTGIRNPKANGASDQVVLEVPIEQVKAEIISTLGDYKYKQIKDLGYGRFEGFKNPIGEFLIFSEPSPTAETSLTSNEDMYESNVFLETNKHSISYRIPTIKNPPVTINVLGKPITITKIIDDNTIEVDPNSVPSCARAVQEERPQPREVPAQPSRPSFFRRFWRWLF